MYLVHVAVRVQLALLSIAAAALHKTCVHILCMLTGVRMCVHCVHVWCVVWCAAGADGGLDFQCIKMYEEAKLVCHLKNKGKYDIAYQ